MHLTLKLKLNPSPPQRAILRQTIQRANEACNGVRQLAWDNQTFRQFDLHKLAYPWMRQEFDLGAQIVIRCIAKVANSYKLDNATGTLTGASINCASSLPIRLFCLAFHWS